MHEILKNKFLAALIIIFILGAVMTALPVTASAEEPPNDGDETIILPEEYYEHYPSATPAFEDGANPFTPNGTGTVVNNATDGDGKEFYTIETPDGNVFYLVIDRQRSEDNVYFLGAVTEQDLMSLAQIEKEPETAAGATFPDNIEAGDKATGDVATEPKTEPAHASETGKDDLTLYVIIGVAILGVGGAGYYLKIVKPKKDGGSPYDDDYGEDYDDDDSDSDDSNYDENDDDEEDGYSDEYTVPHKVDT